MRKVKLADVLWEAANRRLWDGVGFSNWGSPYKNTYSCCAVADAMCSFSINADGEEPMPFLRRLGCPVKSETQRFGTDDLQERQARRYMWLLLAMHVAADENIWIDVK